MNKANYKTNPIPAMKTVDKPAPAIAPPMIPIPVGQPTTLAGIIEVESQGLGQGCEAPRRPLINHQHGCPEAVEESPNQMGCTCSGTDVAFQKTFTVNGHNYLFTSKCCMKCIEVKHKKMLRAYLVDHGAVPGLRLWWKIWRAT